MRSGIVWAIYRKELLEALRDRRTLILLVAVPILLYPLMILGMAKLMEAQLASSEARASRISVWGELPGDLLDRLGKNQDLRVSSGTGLSPELKRDLEAGRFAPPPPSEPARGTGKRKPEQPAEGPLEDAARRLLLDRRVDAVLVAYPGLPAAIEAGRLGHVAVLFDSVRADSQVARQRLGDAVADFRTRLIEERERRKGLEPGFATGIRLHPRNVASSSRRSGQLLGAVLPLILILFSAMGGFYSAIDLTAGEKERGTMQTLLCAPLHSTEIIAGKFLAVWTVALIASLVNVGSMAATFGRLTLPGEVIKVAPSAYVLSFAAMIPVGFTVTAVYLAVAVFARDFKDGQNLLTPLLMGLILPLSVTLGPSIELNAWNSFVPVVNIALVIKALFLGEARADHVFLALLSSTAYALLAILLAARVFARENLLLGGRESFREVFQLERTGRARPSASLSLGLFAVILVLAFYGSLLVQKAGLVVSIVAVEYGFFLLPVVVAIAAAKLSWRETLGLRWPGWRALAASVLLGLAAWTVAGGLLVRLLPPPESLVRALEKILLIEGSVPLWGAWLVVALTPALCEELFFRGFMLSGMRSWGMWPALLVTAVLFGLAHASVYRMLPTLFLGLVFGYAVWKTRSVVCGIIAHALNNGLMATLARWQPPSQALDFKNLTFLPWSWVLAGGALTLIALLILRSEGQPVAAKDGE